MEYPKTNVAKKKIARFGMKGRRKRKKATNNMCVGLKFNPTNQLTPLLPHYYPIITL